MPYVHKAKGDTLQGGVTKDGEQDSRVSSEHGFGGDRERASKEGQKGGSASYEVRFLTLRVV